MRRREYVKICKIRCFPNTDGKTKSAYGNSSWQPYRDGSPADVNFRAGVKHSVQIFKNDDGTVGIDIAEIREYDTTGTDNIADGVSQGGLKPMAEAIDSQYKPAEPAKEEPVDDDIPF
jgi:hypothetical protein